MNYLAAQYFSRLGLSFTLHLPTCMKATHGLLHSRANKPQMSSSTQCVRLLACVAVIFFNQALISEGIRHARGRKYYPEEPPVKTIVLVNGDVIDCVDFYSQPAMDDPYIRENAKLKAIKAETKFHEPVNEKLGAVGPQRWSCPPGSVSFLKATKAGPLNYSALDSFTSSRAKFFSESNNIKPLDDPTQHEYALAHVDDGEYRGGQGTFNIWQPILESRDEMSLMQIWVVRRTMISDTEANIETVEAGYMFISVDLIILLSGNDEGATVAIWRSFNTNNSYRTSLYGDIGKKPFRNNRLRFVRRNDEIPFGMELTPISIFDGDQGATGIKIQRNAAGDWELSVNEVDIGFWPRSNYRDSFPFATMVRWGGEIINHEKSGRHTSTQMGSGHFSSEGIGKAAYGIFVYGY
ncbi:hypothetical protein EJ110_NYTH01791 [Nymphaea thermarum]|nr:hypothetical protein EJ110_NYTH01791 [Nymphaea thermarum]